MASALFPLGHHAIDTRAKSDLIPQAPLADESGRSAALKRPCLCAVRELFRPLGDEAPKCAYNSGFRAAVAQLDRVLGYEPRGRGFESCRARHPFKGLNSKRIQALFLCPQAGRMKPSRKRACVPRQKCPRPRGARALSVGFCLRISPGCCPGSAASGRPWCGPRTCP